MHEYFAHSANDRNGLFAQLYCDHVFSVCRYSVKYADEILAYAQFDSDKVKKIVALAAAYHDLGKLEEANQSVLSGSIKQKSLPLHHADAGTAYLLEIRFYLSAVLVKSHHTELPEMQCGDAASWRDQCQYKGQKVCDYVDSKIDEFIAKHKEALGRSCCNFRDRLKCSQCKQECEIINNQISEAERQNDWQLNESYRITVFVRLLFSCLVDADHGDTARHAGSEFKSEKILSLKPLERLKALDLYVESLGKNNEIIEQTPDQQMRSELRKIFYNSSRASNIIENIVLCDAPVGTGKTTSVMAHLLKVAAERNLRRIFVVLPFTNIISQSVQKYREAICLQGEDPTEVVAELHHRADFDSPDSRKFAARWTAPIVVTTAVAFFETLASATPASLRRLHNLPGSAIFLDEAHAMLPAHLLPIAWFWIMAYAQEWSCHWVLASGSLNQFWNLDEFKMSDWEKEHFPAVTEVKNILPPDINTNLSHFECSRVIYNYRDEPFELEAFVKWVCALPGPVIVVLNTVQTAAAATRMAIERNYLTQNDAKHLSTSLMPKDRDLVLTDVKRRLTNKKDKNWVLFATSCVEAGVDVSFRTGVREYASLVSLLQLAGRVNREGEHQDAEIWSVGLIQTGNVKLNPLFEASVDVLKDFFKKNELISPALCTIALQRELRAAGTYSVLGELRDKETKLDFPFVNKNFKIIDSDTRLVVVDEELKNKLNNFEKVTWQEIQKGSVQIRKYILDKLNVQKFSAYSDLYRWDLEYDNSIGYMAGILRSNELNSDGYAIF